MPSRASWLVVAAIAGSCRNQPAPDETRSGASAPPAPTSSRGAPGATRPAGPQTSPEPPARSTTAAAAPAAPATTAPATPSTTTPATSATTPAAPPAPPAALDTRPYALTCGDQPLALPPPAAMPATLPERPLGRDRPIAVCRDQRSLEALCTCLAGKVDRWADGLHAPARCEPLDRYRATGVQLLEVRSRPADAESTAGGVTFVLAAAQGSKWSPIDAIETAPELDLTVKPHASNDAAIDRFEIRPWADETLIWIESRHETDETAMGERTRTGEASTTVCRVSRTAPSGARSSASCYVSVPRAEWDYTEAIVSDAGCRIRKAVGFAHHLEAGVLTVRLSHGTDLAPVGRFRL